MNKPAPGPLRLAQSEGSKRNGSVVTDIVQMPVQSLVSPSDDELELLADGLDRADLADKDLDALYVEARWHKEQAEHHQHLARYHWTEMGRRVREIKSRVKHGEFIAAVKDEVGIDRKMAWKVMEVAKNDARVRHLPPESGLNAMLDTIKEQKQEEKKALKAAQPVLVIDLPPFVPCNIEVGDCADLPLPDGMVDLIVTSPPYGLGIDYANTDDAEGYDTYMEHVTVWAEEMFRVAKEDGRLCLNVPLDVTYGGIRPIYADWLHKLVQAGWQYRTTIIWDEDNTSKSVARGSVDSPAAPHVFARVEVILVVYKGEWNLSRNADHDLRHEEWLEWTSGMWRFPGAYRADHPAPFPEELPRRCLKLFSFRDAIVLDPFLGSGTTAVEAYRLGRTFYGFDHSPKYVEQAKARVAKEIAG